VIRLRAAALLLAAFLAACVSPPRQPGEPPWTTGRMSLRIDATETQPAQSVSAGFELRGDGSGGELRLNSPLGSRVASARWAPGLAVLTNSDGERRFSNLDELSREALGENLPLAALPDWLAGKPWAGAPHDATDFGFDQLGWQVSLARRGEGWIEARRRAPPAVLVRVRLDEPGS
jgi:outer membrane lipoprotein LolB